MPNLPIWKSQQQTFKLDYLIPIDSKLQSHSHPQLLYWQSHENSPVNENRTKLAIFYIKFMKKTVIIKNEYVQNVLDFQVHEYVKVSDQVAYLFSSDKHHRYLIYQYDTENNKATKMEINGYRPLLKINPVLIYEKKLNCLSLMGSRNYHEYEIASSFWRFSFQTMKWYEVQFSDSHNGWMIPFTGKVLAISKEEISIIDNNEKTTTINIRQENSEGIKEQQEDNLYCYVPEKQAYYILMKNYCFLFEITPEYVRKLDIGIMLDVNLSAVPITMHFKDGILSLHEKPFFKSNNAKIDMKSYWLKVSDLREINLNSPNYPLKTYFNLKEYADLDFFVQGRYVHCSKQLFQHYSPKFRKLYSNSNKNQKPSNKNSNNNSIIMSLNHAKFPTVYFLVEQLYHNLQLPLNTLDQNTLLDLMVLAQKFQIHKLQILCQNTIQPSLQTFPRLYDYYRNSELSSFKDQIIKIFVIHSQELMKTMPIGKVQQLIRLIYSPECQHVSIVEFKTKVGSSYFIRCLENQQFTEHNKNINYGGFLKNQEICLKICQKCHKLLGLGDNHRKNKSLNRDNFVVSGHRKRQNNSN